MIWPKTRLNVVEKFEPYDFLIATPLAIRIPGPKRTQTSRKRLLWDASSGISGLIDFDEPSVCCFACVGHNLEGDGRFR